ncbi:MAG: hypothetical protein Q4B70_17630 [Lachnospiraceae bacterium]|nr:hypothetical protein [Lachnospiraceae bacterium]
MKRKPSSIGKNLYKLFSNRLLGIILFLILFLGFSSIIYTDSYEQTLTEQRKTTYGSWHAALYQAKDTIEKHLESHASVERIGKMIVAGNVVIDGESTLNGMGYIDKTLSSLGNITLLDGTFPEKENEIAIEASYLSRLGYSDQLGQTIHLTILCNNKPNDINSEPVKLTYAFQLSGVIKDYSNQWNTSNNTLVSFFVTPAFCEQLSRVTLLILI